MGKRAWKYYLSFILGLWFIYPLLSRDLPAASEGDLHFVTDRAVFRGTDDKAYCEFYFHVYADQLTIKNRKTKIQTCLTLKKRDGSLVAERSWETESPELSENAIPGQMVIPDIWAEYLERGYYLADVTINDIYSDIGGVVSFTFEVPDFDSSAVSGSQIEFISRIAESSGNILFKKMNKFLMPNPERRYGILNPLLSFYYELYNLKALDADTLQITYRISNSDGSIIKTFPVKMLPVPGESAGILHAVPVAEMKTGIYTLRANVTCGEGLSLIQLHRQFEVIQMDYLTDQPVLTQEQSEIQANILTYLASPAEVRLYERLDLTGKARFLVDFWSKRDPTPETPENEYLQDIQNQYHYANRMYSWANIGGWKTDRGRILIRYGFPDELERHYSEVDTKPYERWIYSRERRFEFIFADLRNSGRFDLIHSTKEGEVKNNAWFSLLKDL